LRNFKFTINWFTDKVDTLFMIQKTQGWEGKPISILEIGSYEGYSTTYFLDVYCTNPESKIMCIDNWKGGIEHDGTDFEEIYETFLYNMNESGKEDQISHLRGNSIDCLCQLQQQNAKYDFIYVDGSHQAPDVLNDCILGFNMLKVGGVIMCDDYLWNQNVYSLTMRPKLAIDSFANVFSDKIEIFRTMSNCFVAKKIKE